MTDRYPDRRFLGMPVLGDFILSEGVEAVQLPPKSPNLNAHLERFMRSIKSECLDRMIFFGEKSLHNAVHQFLKHYHTERNHQGLDNKIIDPGEEIGQIAGKVEGRERLGVTTPQSLYQGE